MRHKSENDIWCLFFANKKIQAFFFLWIWCVTFALSPGRASKRRNTLNKVNVTNARQNLCICAVQLTLFCSIISPFSNVHQASAQTFSIRRACGLHTRTSIEYVAEFVFFQHSFMRLQCIVGMMKIEIWAMARHNASRWNEIKIQYG